MSNAEKNSEEPAKCSDALVDKRFLNAPYPHFTVSVIPFDPETHECAILWRGDGVRSAKNCLALPSGLLEHGENFNLSLARELSEELGLPFVSRDVTFRTLYRNIPGDGFDWVIGIWTMPVFNLRDHAKNVEPHKHDWIAVVPIEVLWLLVQVPGLWSGGLADALRPVVLKLKDELQ